MTSIRTDLLRLRNIFRTRRNESIIYAAFIHCVDDGRFLHVDEDTVSTETLALLCSLGEPFVWSRERFENWYHTTIMTEMELKGENNE